MGSFKYSALVASALLAGQAQAAMTQLDISGIATDSYDIGGPVGLTTGNAGTPLAALSFNLLSPSGRNVWVGGGTGATASLQPNIFGATAVYSMFNTLYGQAGLDTVSVQFVGSAGASQTFTLVGNSDIRDYNNWVWTNTINGTTAQTWWTNNQNPNPFDQTHRWDAQVFSLNAAFATQTLTDIVITAGAAGPNYSQPMLAALNVEVAAVPEPSAALLFLAGAASLALMRRRNQTHSLGVSPA